jgi:hypothetical protein
MAYTMCVTSGHPVGCHWSLVISHWGRTWKSGHWSLVSEAGWISWSVSQWISGSVVAFGMIAWMHGAMQSCSHPVMQSCSHPVMQSFGIIFAFCFYRSKCMSMNAALKKDVWAPLQIIDNHCSHGGFYVKKLFENRI